MLRRLLIVPVLLSMAVDQLPGQTLGEITGVVTDPSSAVVPNASVTVTNTATNGVDSILALVTTNKTAASPPTSRKTERSLARSGAPHASVSATGNPKPSASLGSRTRAARR